MKKIKGILIFLLLVATGVIAYADEKFVLTASAPEAVVSGDQFRLTYTINTQKVKDFRAPSIQGFDVLMGPSRSHQSNTQIINGQISSSSSITYTYMLLANEAGTYQIPAASIVAENQTVTSNALTIKVLPPDQSNTSAGTSGRRGGSNTSSRTSSSGRSETGSSNEITNEDLFVIATVNKTNVYEQEAFLLTYKIYSLVNLSSIERMKIPDFKGFHSQEISLSKNPKTSLEHYNGRNYRTILIHQSVLFPQQTGKLEIPSAQFDAVVAKAVRSVDPFDAFFNGGSSYVEMKKTISTPKLTINVKPLPTEGKPASFSGAVGNFSLSSTINSEEVKTNDAITIKLVLSGTGNMKLINSPEVGFSKDFEIFDPKVDNKFTVSQNGLSGNKVIEYLAIPRHPGNYKIPAIEFSYFDLKSKSYKTLKTQDYTIKVAKGEGNADQVIANFTSKEDLRMLGSDIRFLKLNETQYSPKGNYLFGSLLYMLCYLIPFCLFLVLLLVNRKKAVENANVAKVKTKKANKMAVKRLKLAKKLLAENEHNKFYDEVLKALWGYISDKLNIPVSQLSKDNIEYELAKYGVNEELIKEFINVLHDCEFARYAPGDANAAMDHTYKSAINVISKMESNIKH